MGLKGGSDARRATICARVAEKKHVVEVPGAQLIRFSRWALAVTVGCLPLYVVRFHVGPLPSTLLEVLIGITVVLWAAGRYQTREWHPARTPLEIPMAIFLIAGLIGIAVSPDHVGALGIYRAYFIEPAVLFYVAIDLLRKPDDFRIVLAGFAAGTTVFAIANLGAWVIALSTTRLVDIDLGNAPKFLYTSPNSVAMFLEPAVTLAAGFALYSSNRRDRIVALVCLPFLLASLVATLSRAGFFTVAVLVLVALITIRRRRLKLGLLAAVVVGGIALLQVPAIARRMAHQFDPNYPNNTFEGRLQIWSDTLRMLRDHPIFGAGLRGYAIVMRPYVTTPKGLPELYAHDIFLSMWVEIGLLGLAAFVVLLGILLWRGWASFSNAGGFPRALLWGTSAAFVAITAHGLFDTPYYGNDLSVEFWMLAALEIAAISTLLPNATRNRPPERLG
jgi:putative inorganic carbon (HCO3(-)) transporter